MTRVILGTVTSKHGTIRPARMIGLKVDVWVGGAYRIASPDEAATFQPIPPARIPL
jgi:hypothetical protein